MQVSKRDAIISAWRKEGEALTYTRIKQHLVDKNVIKETNDSSVSRWLKSLVKEGVLKRTEEGYTLELKPKTYQVFDYLNEIRQKYSRYIYEGEVGGWFSHVCAMTYLNFEETFLQEIDEKVAFDIISVRIAELFFALYLLKNAVVKRRCGLKNLALPETVVREAFFGMLDKSVGVHGTDEIVEKYSRFLFRSWKEQFRKLWKQVNGKRRLEMRSYGTFLFEDIFLERILGDVEGNKRLLKKTAFIDIEKYSLSELFKKFVQIHEWIEKNHEREMLEEHAFMFTREESELENNYRMAILTKLAEAIEALGTDLENFAVILTRHPATMSRYYTPEHILYYAMEWARKPPEDDLLKGLWHEVHEREKSFEGMVAERLVTMGRFSVQEYEKLRSKPWVLRELASLGDFDKVLKIYSKKRKKHLKEIQKVDARDFLGLPKKSSKEAD